MAQTPLTGAAPYCTPAALLTHKDANAVADTLADDGSRPSRSAMLDPASAVGAVLARICQRASGDFEAALVGRGRYAPGDLAALLADNENMAALIEGVVADVAYLRLVGRRQPVAAKVEDVPSAKLAIETLEQLRVGERDLGFVENAAAGEGMTATAFADPRFDPNLMSNRIRRVLGNHG